MPAFLEDILQITIYLKKGGDNTAERINEVALFKPLEKKARFNSETPHIKQRKWSFTDTLPLQKKALLKVQTFFLHHFPTLVRQERKSPEAIFKTVLALLLAQETLREFFLEDPKQKENFFESIQKTANATGYTSFTLPPLDTPKNELCRLLTKLPFHSKSLIEDPAELSRQLASLKRESRDQLLFLILNQIERQPVTSVLEVSQGEKGVEKISITTLYGKYKVHKIDEESGAIDLQWDESHVLSSIKTQPSQNLPQNLSQNLGLINQHLILDTSNKVQLLGGFSGELTTYYHLLEQILFLLQEKGSYFLEEAGAPFLEEKTFLFTSLFSWNEYEKICEEHAAIEKLHGKVLIIENERMRKSYRLSLLHLNIPFNAFNKFPLPSEIDASINDINNKCLIHLAGKVFAQLSAPFLPLQELIEKMQVEQEEMDFFKREHFLIESLDRFKALKTDILAHIETLLSQEKSASLIALKALLKKKNPNNKSLHGVDALIYSSLLARLLNIISNKNSAHATDRSASAVSLDKAQNAFLHLLATPFLPGLASEKEEDLFKVFYSMYLVFEEPELNTGLTTGFIGEKFYNNFIQKNPETTHYLTSWLKEHPEIYLGLSDYRF